MESSDQRATPDPVDWDLLSVLFAQGGDYRHRMGLRRAHATEFYAATSAGPEIRGEKQAILGRDGDRYTVVSRDGHRAAIEFARTLGLPTDEDLPDHEASWQLYNRQLSLALEPDLLVVQPPDWSLVWASVCFPSRWSLEGKAHRPLSWIHDAVPNLNAELGDKIGVFFTRLAPGEGWRRANWGFSGSCARNQHPEEPIPPLTAANPLDQVFLRVEDQHLLKLPETGAIAFGIRIASFAWSAIRRNDEIASSILEKLRTMSPEIARYKSVSELFTSITKNR